MNTITVYLDDEPEGGQRRRGTAATKYLFVAGVAAIGALALADRPGAAPVVETVRVVTTTVIQVQRVPTSCEQFGPPAPPSRDVVSADRRDDKPKPVERRKISPPRPRPLPSPAISPLRLSFLAPGWEPVAIVNPHDVPIRIRNIAVRGIDGGVAESGFDIIGAAQCIGTLRPREHCRFNVFARPSAYNRAAIRIEIHHDADPKPLTIRVRMVSRKPQGTPRAHGSAGG